MPKKATSSKTSKKKNDTLEAFSQIGDFRNLPQDVVREALCEAIEKGYRKRHDCDQARIKTVFNPDGTIKAFRLWDVVDTVEFPDYQLDVEEAKDITPNPVVGEVLEEETEIEDFGRSDISTVKSVILQKIKEAEKKEIIDEYKDKVGDLVTGLVESVENRFVIVRLGATPDGKLQGGATDAMMRKIDQIPGEVYNEGEHIKCVITKVDTETKGATVLVSRSDNDMIKRLFEKEVPEIYKGTIEIKAIARDPGLRAKMAVLTTRENIDPIGACIGPGGSRVKAITKELNGEKIDIFEWSDDLQQLSANALSPAQGIQIFLAEKAGDALNTDRKKPLREGKGREDKKVLVAAVPDNQLSLAIGKKGQNARLAMKLTGHRIDIRSQSELDELGIDWRSYVQEMHDEYEAKKAAERAYKQQLRIEELKKSEPSAQELPDYDEFAYNDDYDDHHLDEVDSLSNTEEPEQKPETVSEKPAAPAAKPEPVEEPELDEMEQAAKIAKEKRKSLAERRTIYVSKFENLENQKSEEEQSKKHKSWKSKDRDDNKKDDKKVEKKKPAFNAIHPIYTEEELEEIENNEIEEEMNASWNDDVDYEEYDSYYDEEY